MGEIELKCGQKEEGGGLALCLLQGCLTLDHRGEGSVYFWWPPFKVTFRAPSINTFAWCLQVEGSACWRMLQRRCRAWRAEWSSWKRYPRNVRLSSALWRSAQCPTLALSLHRSYRWCWPPSPASSRCRWTRACRRKPPYCPTPSSSSIASTPSASRSAFWRSVWAHVSDPGIPRSTPHKARKHCWGWNTLLPEI